MSEVEAHLFASMRVAQSGVWRRAFVRSCVSLRNRGCSKLSVVPLIVRFRWHRNTMLLSRRSQRVENYHVISIFVCLIHFFLFLERIYIQLSSFLFQFAINIWHRYIYRDKPSKQDFNTRNNFTVDSLYIFSSQYYICKKNVYHYIILIIREIF